MYLILSTNLYRDIVVANAYRRGEVIYGIELKDFNSLTPLLSFLSIACLPHLERAERRVCLPKRPFRYRPSE